MSFLIGKKLLNNTFYQDIRKDWIKIKNVVLGESPHFGYKTVNSNNIGKLLDSLIKDSSVVAVLWNSKEGVAYVKSGVNLTDASDSKLAPGYTTFLVTSRVSSNANPIPTPVPSTVPVPAGNGNFVKIVNGQFQLNGQRFYSAGFNAYNLGLTEERTYPSKAQQEEIFWVAQKIKANTIRSHTLGISCGSQNSLRPWDNNLNENAWDPIDHAFMLAGKYNIKLICPILDAYDYYHGSYGDFCKPRGVIKTEFFNDWNVRNDFKDFINKWLNHVNKYTGIAIKDDPSLFMIELGNELGVQRPNAGSTAIPSEDWLKDISSYIKSLDNNHIILCPTDETLGQSNEFNIQQLDAFSQHLYWNDWNRINDNTYKAANVGKPMIIGEYSSRFDNAGFFNIIEANPNIQGDMFWSLYYHENGLVNGWTSGNPVPHEDSFTLHWSPKDYDQLLIISNHYRRKLGLPEVNSL